MSNPEIDEDGTKQWYNDYDQLHRLDGPAVEYVNGEKYWFVNGLKHRLDGPAYEGSNGDKTWYVHGELHRLDGPAIEWIGDTKEWYINDKRLSSPLDLLEHGVKLEDIAEYLTPREIAKCKTHK